MSDKPCPNCGAPISDGEGAHEPEQCIRHLADTVRELQDKLFEVARTVGFLNRDSWRYRPMR
jgi:hypothetical protein